MTKIRPARLAEIEADDFSQFPSLAYAKGFLLIYGKFLDVDVTPYLDAFEDSERVTVDGYSYLQENRPEKPVSAPVVPRRPVTSSHGDRVSPMPLIVGIVVLVFGFLLMKLVLNVQRLAPGRGPSTAQVSPSLPPVSPAPTQASQSNVAAASPVATTPSPERTTAPNLVAAAAVRQGSGEPEVRRARPVTREDIAKAEETANPAPAESGDKNRVAIRPLKRTYVKVTVGDENAKPAFERWVSPTDGTVEFSGKRISIRVLDREAVAITKNGKELEDGDQDVTVN